MICVGIDIAKGKSTMCFVSRIRKFAIPNLFLPFDRVIKRNAPVDSPHFLDAGVTKPAEVFMFNVICRRNCVE